MRRGIDQFDTFGGALEVYNSAHQHLMQNKPYDENMQKKTQGCLTVRITAQIIRTIAVPLIPHQIHVVEIGGNNKSWLGNRQGKT